MRQTPYSNISIRVYQQISKLNRGNSNAARARRDVSALRECVDKAKTKRRRMRMRMRMRMRRSAAGANVQCLEGRTRRAPKPQPTDRPKARRQGRRLVRRLYAVIAAVRVPEPIGEEQLGDVACACVPLTPIARASGMILYSIGSIGRGVLPPINAKQLRGSGAKLNVRPDGRKKSAFCAGHQRKKKRQDRKERREERDACGNRNRTVGTG